MSERENKRGGLEQSTFSTTPWVGMPAGAATKENNTKVSQEIKNANSIDPTIPPQGIYQEKTKTLIRKAMCTPIFTAVLFTVAEIGQPPRAVHRGTGKEMRCRAVEYYTARKRRALFVCNDMGGPGVRHAK